MSKKLKSSDIPEPQEMKGMRQMLLNLLSEVEAGNIMSLTVIGEHVNGSPLMATTGAENVYTLGGFAITHFLDRMVDNYYESLAAAEGYEEDEGEDEDE